MSGPGFSGLRFWAVGGARQRSRGSAILRAGLALLLVTSTLADDWWPVYLNPDCPVEERVEDLIGRLDVPEKIGLFLTENPPIPRLGVRTWSWWNEGTHGVARAGKATVFPVPVALAATWDVDLMTRVATAISLEARAKHNEAPTNRYHGLTFWSPCLDLARDPRWGRVEETYGEDPWLAARLGLAYVRALQGDDPHYLRIVATPKHFAVHAQETGRHSTAVEISEQTLREYYLEPFRVSFVDGQARSCMTAYSGINGIPCMINQWLITDLLRGEWGFRGAVVTDWHAPDTIRNAYKVVPSHEDTMALALTAGIDILCQQTMIYSAMTAAVESGLVTEPLLDQSLRRSLELRFRLGVFDPPERVPFAQLPLSLVGSEEHVALALESSRKAIVLLKNDPVRGRVDPTPLLPLDPGKLDSIAVIGSHANRVFLGAYSGQPAMPAVTTYAGMTNRLPAGVLVRHVAWSDLDEQKRRLKKNETLDPKTVEEQKQNLAAAIDAAARSDVAVVVLGLNHRIESEGRDRTDLNLPKDQQEFVEKVVAVNPATIVVLLNGGPLAIHWLHQHVPAIIEAWYPGEQGGNAITDVILGDHNPAGRLPLTFYAGLEQLPGLFDHEISHGRTYMHLRTPPLYPFGHGLSYSCFEYRSLQLDRPVAGTNDTLAVRVEIANTSERDGEEVVQLYVRDVSPRNRIVPLQRLRGFQRVFIPAGETRVVELALLAAELAYWDTARQAFVTEPGEYEVRIGASASDIRLSGKLSVR